MMWPEGCWVTPKIKNYVTEPFIMGKKYKVFRINDESHIFVNNVPELISGKYLILTMDQDRSYFKLAQASLNFKKEVVNTQQILRNLGK